MQLVDSILQPERLRACEASLQPEALRRMWPREVAEKTFIAYLWSQYAYTQLGAIEVSLHQALWTFAPLGDIPMPSWVLRELTNANRRAVFELLCHR